ncbi:asparagine synthetase B [Catalinimonas niigatensis]|uniref:asparagine synthetase B n=1 Tax=Catalinimonas niigatensis TaxID=1397264 RepID=UPI0026667C1C|nr:asparagine synthetase B [Catalinimonas niigatensis]WPP51704.1 asparagine synthetase B [Catalinimonas niigatensis]
MKVLLIVFLSLASGLSSFASTLLIPMDESQTNHLKAYGIVYWTLEQEVPVDWLLNYRGGSFMCRYDQSLENELVVRGVSYEVISDAEADQITSEIASPSSNQDLMRLEQYPKVAVYSPKTANPWDDAVMLALDYAEIPYEIVFDDEVLMGELPKYDWLHLHHEDFTGQYSKFYVAFHMYSWYQEKQREYEETARKHGFTKVSEMKMAVTQKISEFVSGGGFMFAMCLATDTYDIALAASGLDIVGEVYDGDGIDPNAQEKLDYSKTFAFQDFNIVKNPWEIEFSDIDINLSERNVGQENDYFQLFEFSAKWDPIPTMLTQNHERNIKGFLGATTAFRKSLIRSEAVIMGENRTDQEVKYLHGVFGKGFWTFYGGHDPEDYQHNIGEPPTDLNLYPNSPGYRLILNNVLFPAAKKKKQKT